MNTQRKQFVTSLIMLGMLTMILAVLAIAEKSREDGHLPERNRPGSGEILSMIVGTGLVGFLVPGFQVFSRETKQHTGQTALPVSRGMRCPPTFLIF
jgi:hypothetical protein